jgi:hypothetical protein
VIRLAKLYYRYGAMGSSKSANAIMVQYNYQERNQRCLMAKPRMENRDGERTIRSRSGLSTECVFVEELAEMETIRNGTRNTDDTGEPASTLAPLSTQDLQGMCADRAESLFGTTFKPMTDEWKEGDDPAEYNKIFLVRIGAYLDDGYESSDPLSDAAKVDAAAKRGSVLRFDWDGQFRYAMYLGNGQMAYADAEDMTVRCAYVSDWLNDKEGKPGCTCSVLSWR